MENGMLKTKNDIAELVYLPGADDSGIEIEIKKTGEFAVVFSGGGRHYTCGIVKKGSAGRLSVPTAKIAFADNLSVVNIDTDESVASIVITPAVTTKAGDAAAAAEAAMSAALSASVDAKTVVSAESGAAVPTDNDERAYGSVGGGGGASAEGDSAETPKKNAAAGLINNRQGCLPAVFSRYSGLTDAKENEKFYIFDEYAAKKNDMKILYSGNIVPLDRVFLDYKNTFAGKASLPEKLIGESIHEGKVAYYIFAVCGRDIEREQPFGGATGFVYHYDSADGYGYWLCYINAENGRISIPVRSRLLNITSDKNS